MKQNFILSCCSTVDLTKEHLDGRDIHYTCMHYFLDGKEYPDDLGQSMPFDVFYRKMQEGADTRTSQVNVEEFMKYNEIVTTETIDKLCEYFQCQPDEILEFIPNEHEKERLQ